MSLYQKIKSAITVRQVGEMYGMEPDRHGMVCCPFHSDSDPSMKLNDTYYYCFGCGANGDAIDLTAKLFDLNQINLLEAQGDHVSEREYWAQRRGQRRLDHANAKLATEGQQLTQTVYQTELDKLRKQIYAVLNKTTTFEEFSALPMQEHGIAIAVAGVLTAVLCPIFAALL